MESGSIAKIVEERIKIQNLSTVLYTNYTSIKKSENKQAKTSPRGRKNQIETNKIAKVNHRALVQKQPCSIGRAQGIQRGVPVEKTQSFQLMTTQYWAIVTTKKDNASLCPRSEVQNPGERKRCCRCIPRRLGYIWSIVFILGFSQKPRLLFNFFPITLVHLTFVCLSVFSHQNIISLRIRSLQLCSQLDTVA